MFTLRWEHAETTEQGSYKPTSSLNLIRVSQDRLRVGGESEAALRDVFPS